MAYDANLVLAASGAVTSTTNHTSVDLVIGTPRRGLKARIVVTAVSGTSPTAAYKIQTSTDNSTFVDAAVCESNNVTATGEYFIPFETSSRYVRLVATIGGTTPSFTYSAQIVDCRP